MNRNTECIRNPEQRTQARVAALPLDIGNVAARQVATFGEDLLRPALAFARGSDLLRETPADFDFGLWFHGSYQIRLNERVSLMRVNRVVEVGGSLRKRMYSRKHCRKHEK